MSKDRSEAVSQPATSSSGVPWMPRLVAMLLAVPSGRMAMGTRLCASARATRAIVPSPPAATTTLAPVSSTR